MKNMLCKAWIVFCAVFSLPLCAAGDRVVEKILSSDFDFSVGESESPFMRIGYLEVQNYLSGDVKHDCPDDLQCQFDQVSIQQGFGMPLWVGKKNMFVMAESLNLHHFTQPEASLNLFSAGVLAAWIQQYDTQIQWGAFYYKKLLFNDMDDKFSTPGYTVGFVSRYRHRAALHSYWGVIRDRTNQHTQWLPYAGFDWTINPHWQLFAVAPWPSINYAPDPATVFVLGVSPSGSYLPLHKANTRASFTENYAQFGDFLRWDLSLRAEKQVSDLWWVGVSVGAGLFGSISIQEKDGSRQSIDLKDSGFFMLSLSLRPE